MSNQVLKRVGIAFALLWAAGIASSAWAQSQNSRALAFFKTGNEERDLQRKAAAYLRAVEIDSTFAEAYYNLGMVYKQLQDYPRTEQYLRKASSFKLNRFASEQRNRLLYELALALKKQRKATEAESMLREAKASITDKKLKSMASFELGKLLFEANRVAEALEELRDGQRIDASSQTYFNNLIQIAENNLALQAQYDQAVQTEKRGELQEARTRFVQIQTQRADFNDVAARVARLDSMLSAENTRKQTLVATYEQAQQYEKAGDFELAIPVYEHLLQQKDAPADLRTRLEQARAKLEQKRLAERAESEYAVGLAALKAQNWTGAILAFERVLEINGNYPNVREKINEAQSSLQRESNDNICARYYADGLSAMERSDWGGALAAFEKVRRLEPDYREVKNMLAQVERALEVPDQPAEEVKPVADTRVQALYDEALDAAAKADWMRAVVNLETIHLLQPNYRDVVDRLAEARAHLSAGAAAASAGKQNAPASLNLALVLTAVVALPLLGLLFFSPTMRARYHLLRGNHAAVARIYESMLAKNPQRAKLNPAIVTTLSNYYLMSGRVDDHARELYKAAQASNLISGKSEEINALLQQRDYTQPDQNMEALRVLENSLNNRKISPHSSK